MPLWFFTKVLLIIMILRRTLTACTGLLEAVLFAQIRFHDTVSRGRLLNRFGKDFEGAKLDISRNYVTESHLIRHR